MTLIDLHPPDDVGLRQTSAAAIDGRRQGSRRGHGYTLLWISSCSMPAMIAAWRCRGKAVQLRAPKRSGPGLFSESLSRSGNELTSSRVRRLLRTDPWHTDAGPGVLRCRSLL